MSFINEIGKKHKKRTINFIKLWDELAAAYVKRNDSDYGELRPYSNMYVDMAGLYSKEDYVSYIFTIDGYPRELENSYITTLRRECSGDVRISFITPLEKHQIEWNSAKMKARMRTWKILETDTSTVDEYNLYNNLSALDSQDWRKDSLVYLSTAEIRRKRKMFKVRTMMIISGIRGENFNNTVKKVINLCGIMHIKISRITGDIPEYIKTFSPFSNTFDPQVFDKCGSVVLTDELVARFNTYTQGIIGKEGIYWGTDIYSQFPCLKPVKKTTEDAENWLITAETGGGKSYFVKALLSQLLAQNEYNGTIMDIEGFEYKPFKEELEPYDQVVIVNMGEGSGKYYDPVEIMLTGDADLDADMYSLSTSFTLSLFKCLMGTETKDDEWADIVITDAVALTYGHRGIDAADPSTWKKSKGMTLYDVYETLKTLKVSGGDAKRAINSMYAHSLYMDKMGVGNKLSMNDINRLVTSNENYQQSIDLCVAKISRYFEENGVRSSLFRERITIEDVRDAKLVICSFGMAGKSQNSVDPIQMALMQLYAANISHLRSIFGKHKGQFNFKLWEEFQRWGGFPDADKTINVALTGGRKLGDINIIITNKVVDMLNDDKFGVFSNVTSIAIGAIGDSYVRSELCNRLSIPQMIPELDNIAANNKDLDAYIRGDTLSSNPYKKAFLIGLDRTVYTISKMSLPYQMRESNLFRTGIDKNIKQETQAE